MIYAYNSRTWAEKYAARVGGSVFSVQGFINTAYRGTIEWHWNIMLEAERAFN
jgi:hypothetical protein